MTIIVNKYIGITHPVTGDGLEEKQFNMLLEAWKHSNCIQGIHLWDEVWSNEKHVLHCDACGIEIYIEKVSIPDGKDDIIDNSNKRK
jgi:hypothetical protein